MADHDRIEGAAKNIGGKVKEGVGKVTGDEKLKAEGRAEQVEGKVQNTVGGIKDAINDKH
ncbi:CsbD family protein [Brevundimonas sp.]|uniref:CsbD family protein n=1 Tax=Brevundimonas sp. TaxID=1871086 RepID=UPI00286C2DE9|nr:CsbD family protein [Brevundimonas sp.]